MVQVLDQPDMIDQVVASMMQQLMPLAQPERSSERTVDRVSLASMVEQTSYIRLDAWQKHMCARLQRLTYETGQHILLHAPPQFGKSIIVSQRLPAYILGDDPINRVRVACFNIERSTKFAKATRRVMGTARYRALFGNDERLIVPSRSREDEWSTAAREELADAQSSMKALGLLTGFVGDGADTLIIDDPYASPQDAYSKTIRDNTWSFWDETARVRLNSLTNVIVMFHRYHQDDIAGRLITEEGLKSQGGKWELLRYCAEWDGDDRWEVGGEDPLGRTEIGQLLSPRFDREWIEGQKKKTLVWLAQFQGKPTNKEGTFFKTGMIEIVDTLPVDMKMVVRTWDLAASEEGHGGEPAETAGVKAGLGADGYIYLMDVVHGYWESSLRDNTIKLTAQLDNQPGPFRVKKIRIPQDPGQAGKSQVKDLTIKLKGFPVESQTVSGDKETRATPVASYVNAGNVRMLNDQGAGWNQYTIAQLAGFPRALLKDIVDALSDAFDELVLEDQYGPGQQFNMLYDDTEDDEERMLREIAAENVDLGGPTGMEGLNSTDDIEGIWINGNLHWVKKQAGASSGSGAPGVGSATDTATGRRRIRHPQADRGRSSRVRA